MIIFLESEFNDGIILTKMFLLTRGMISKRSSSVIQLQLSNEVLNVDCKILPEAFV